MFFKNHSNTKKYTKKKMYPPPLSYSDGYILLNMHTTTCMQWHFQAAQSQRALHPNLYFQHLFHNLPVMCSHFLTPDCMVMPVFPPRASQDASSPQPHKPDLHPHNASVTPLLLPKLMDGHASGASPATTINTNIPQMTSAVSTPLSWIDHEDFVPDVSVFDCIDAMPDRSFLCQRLDHVCTFAFNTEEELKQHEAVAHAVQKVVTPMRHGPARPSVSSTTTDEKPVGRLDPVRNQWVFDCTHEGCDKTYTTRNRVKIHSYSHSGLKPYHCSTCDYAATQKSSVNVHMLIHLSAKDRHEHQLARKGTIECPACHRMYKTMATLGRHKCHAANK
ncbi:hypothetical protein BJ741DRAFT_621084 [Chytriomyces cf. hyalinus JEL632]|nr:hypothetical protein BJ741DRAFT_621084 [Chytriomyces cf. hyalinus JEL632]